MASPSTMAAAAANAAVAAATAAALSVNHPPRTVTVAATQFACTTDIEANIRKAEKLVRDAARKGANVILLQELFASTYFCIEQIDYFRLAISLDDDKSYIPRFQALARELGVVLPLSFYERSNNAYFNSVLVIDADGSHLGTYRKSHIPDGPGYQEKFYFSPGDTGFRVFKTRFGALGIGVCWDQWFPEAARVLVLQGAEILLYPTAIGSEPTDPAMDTCSQWQRCIQGHSAANMIPIVASNRVGKEVGIAADISVTFYGSSFITDHTGAIVSDAGRHQETTLIHTFNLDEIRITRHQWGVFRDRRPELYTSLLTFDGANPIDRRSPFPAAFTNNRVSLGSSTVQAMTPTKKIGEPDQMVTHGMVPVVEDTPRRVVNTSFDLHEATFIGDVRQSAQRRPRGRCWVCRAKTTYECKLCTPGPVPLCNRTARECWWKYHAGDITTYVPNKRGRKRRKFSEQDVLDADVGESRTDDRGDDRHDDRQDDRTAEHHDDRPDDRADDRPDESDDVDPTKGDHAAVGSLLG